MSDIRHKKPPPKGESEINTKTFRDEAEEVLRRNETLNRLAGRKRGEHGYLIASHADIASKLAEIYPGVTQRMVDKILGAVRPGSKIKLVGSSVYVKPIREMLGLQRIELAVPVDRAEVLAKIAGLPDKEFAPFREAIERRDRR